jgi:plasmid maintenance system antidote protein VapI
LYEHACKKIGKPSGIKEHEIAEVLGRTRPTVSQKCREYGEAMLAFLDEFPQGWPDLQRRTNIRDWCRKKG